MRKIVAIMVAKLILYIRKKRGKGSAYPGEIALKICPNILKYIKMPSITIAVTATVGKTSTTAAIAHILKQSGYSVAYNSFGTNISNGIVTLLLDNCNLWGRITKDVIVMEIDERHTKEIFKFIKPNYLIINNIIRDQAPRNGNLEVVFRALKKSLDDSIHLILNADDPIVSKLAIDHKGKVTYFGINETKFSYRKDIITNLDIAYCPKCNQRLKFDYLHYGNIGYYACPNGDFKREKPTFAVTEINYDKNYFLINNKHQIIMKNDILYHVYNMLATFTVSSLIGLDENVFSTKLSDLSFKIIRFEKLKLDNRECIMLACKNETPISYDQSLLYIKRHNDIKTVVMGFNKVCSRYTYSDLGWLWDADFEILKDNNIDKIVCIGKFAYDIATRLIYSGIEEKRIIICKSVEESIPLIREKTKGNIYAALNFDIIKEFSNTVKKVEV